MNTPSLSIQTERPELEIRTQRAQINLTQPKPKMRISSTPAKMRVQRRAPTFKVNWKKIRAQMGQKTSMDVQRGIIDEAAKKANEGIVNISQMGDKLAHTEQGHTVPSVVRDRLRATLQKVPELNVKLMPEEKPTLDWDEGYVSIDWTEHTLEIEWDLDGKPHLDYEPYVVEIKLKNRPSMRIKVISNKSEKEVGSKLDKKV